MFDCRQEHTDYAENMRETCDPCVTLKSHLGGEEGGRKSVLIMSWVVRGSQIDGSPHPPLIPTT